MSLLETNEVHQLDDVEARLIATFSPPLRAEEVQRCLAEAVVAFQDATVRTYLPVLIERAATKRLQLCARSTDSSPLVAGPSRQYGGVS